MLMSFLLQKSSCLATPNFAEPLAKLRQRTFPRAQLRAILTEYNREIGNDVAALQQIDKLQSPDTHCIITGQQLGLLGGPAYTILKAISCLQLAKETGGIPLFWLATEDHDTGEINHTYSLNEKGNLHRFHLHFPHVFVEDLQLTSEQQKAIQDYLSMMNVHISFQLNSSYAKSMASLLAALFKGTGLVFLEPKLLRPLAVPFFKKELLHHGEIQSLLKKEKENLAREGKKTPLAISEGTNLFIKNGHHQRIKIKNHEHEMLDLLEKEPERFSTNAAARPVLQSALFPTLAYVAGPSEMQYYPQLRAYHEWHGVDMPLIVPRIGATILTPTAARYLKHVGLAPWQEIPKHWEEVFPETADNIDLLCDHWEKQLTRIDEGNLSKKEFLNALRQEKKHIRKSTWKMVLKQIELPYHTLHFLNNLLHPHQKLQERVLNWVGLQAATKENLIAAFLEQTKWNERGHYYILI